MKKFAMETSVGIFVFLGLILIGYMTVKLGHVDLFGSDSYPLNAKFTSVSGLRIGSPVKMLGMEVGRVESMKIDQEDLKAVVEFRIKNEMMIYDDAIASIKTEGLIGDCYLSIDPGGGGAVLAADGTITETQPAVEISDLIGKYAFGDVQSDLKSLE
ncbi:MAG: outer membrane lipid asymmetry maintenance protein MlaD [Syntrophales bacterium]|jgi:phospholipid/cholesterol/gamma-HCH transport system substrate-binding protein|nr:outer membrane lipid asymmetry maintenance protein MlaD [Syntrophales bacterium]NLN60761.1 outer membrane lipid asymmetry maintenance protein MlaD [Deltaproteobacteria bacterium]